MHNGDTKGYDDALNQYRKKYLQVLAEGGSLDLKPKCAKPTDGKPTRAAARFLLPVRFGKEKRKIIENCKNRAF